MKRILYIILFFALNSCYLMAQNEDNIWVLGNQLGLDFNSGSPIVISSSSFGHGGTASVSDEDGNLLFYTNGYWVWNRNHEMMPELTGGVAGYYAPLTPDIGYPALIPFPGSFCYQSAVITNSPNEMNQYYIFSTNNSYLFYSKIDMELNDGMGGIVMDKKAIPMVASTNGALTVVEGCNCIWIVCHAYDQNRIFAFEVNDTGIVMEPVISDIGSIPAAWNFRGCISFSSDGSKLAKTTNDPFPLITSSSGYTAIKGGIELFDFDKTTGKFSNPQLLEINDTSGNYYDACFSPNGSQLYISKSSHRIYRGQILQFNVSLESTAAIIDSRNIVYEHALDGWMDDNLGGIKTGADDKIYFISGKSSGLSNPYIHSINNPNNSGSDCNVDPYAVMIPTSNTGTKEKGFPNDLVLIDSIIWDTLTIKSQVNVCFDATAIIQATDTMGRHYKWNDGSSGYQKSVNTSGWQVLQYVNTECKRVIDSIYVNIAQVPMHTSIAYSCVYGAQATFWVQSKANDTNTYQYQWMDAAMNILQSISSNSGDTLSSLNPGIYYVQVSTGFGCDTLLSLEVLPLPQPTAAIIMDSVVCNGLPITFAINTHPNNSYLWLYGNHQSITDSAVSYHYTDLTDYRIWLTVTNPEGCSDTLYKDIQTKSFDFRLSASDTIIDRGTLVDFYTHSSQPYDMISWEPAWLFPNPYLAQQSAKFDTSYCIQAMAQSKDGCIGIDSVWVMEKPEIYFPSAFSPNGDGLNDYFRPVGYGAYNIQVFEIYNRWGEQVYYSFGPQAYNGWDGTYNGQAAPPDVYYYRINIVTVERATQTYKGDVTLIR